MSDLGVIAGQERPVDDLAALIDRRVVPTAEQRTVIGAGLEPTLVVAGAGSGKTETLSMRMVYLLDHAERLFGRAISPEEILCLTFTRKAAAEIAERADERIERVFGGDPERAAPAVATYNGYAAALVAEHGLRLAIDPDSTMLTNAALWQMAASLVEQWRETIEVDAAVSSVVRAVPRLAQQLQDHQCTPGELRAWAEHATQFMEELPKKAGQPGPGAMTKSVRGVVGKFGAVAALADLVEAFQARKREGSLVDFSDQVAAAVDLSQMAAVQAIERSRYRVVLLDEFQDTSPGQLQLFAQMFGADHPVMAVGDPHQAIYGFRGASASALSTFVDRFGGPQTVRQASLAVSWRNESSVLLAANAASAPLRKHAAVHVEPLRAKSAELGVPEPPRTTPGVSAHYAEDLRAEAATVVEFVQSRRQELAAEGTATAAVLCRRRAQFGPIVEAFDHAGIDYEVVGLGGLLDTPEVADVVALLEVAHDPSRGDSLMRLLTSERVCLGASDLMALRAWADHVAGPRDSREAPPSIVDAMAELPPQGWVSRDGRALTGVARERLADLQRAVHAIRTHTYLPLTELVLFAERAWDLDIEAAVARPDGRAARNIDAFVGAARAFQAGADHATLGALLAWLDAAREEEAGLDAPVKEPDPYAVQILTVHAAKGLEWDVVAVPGLNDGQFPKVTVPSTSQPAYRDSAWLQGIGDLPWELRMDAGNLPEWEWAEVADHAELLASVDEFKERAGTYRMEEERRLFYVAITRARAHVLLSGAWFATGATVKTPSLFLQELVDQGLVDDAGWAVPPGDDAEPPDVHAPPVSWPAAATEAQQQRRAFADAVMSAAAQMPSDGGFAPHLPLAREVSAMVAERRDRAARVGEVLTPAHLSTSALVSLRRDRGAFVTSLRRPLPAEPTFAAARGSALHAWIERQYGHQSLLTDEDLGPDDDAGPDLAELQETFAASEWAPRQPTDIEVDVEVPVGPVTVRSRIDAVFPPGRGLTRVTVVDWKSGRPPADEEERAAREVQLAVYRLAWAEWKGLDVDDVDAAFYYVATDQTVRPARLLTREQMVELIVGA